MRFVPALAAAKCAGRVVPVWFRRTSRSRRTAIWSRALEKEYPVLLVRLDQNAVEGLHVYHGEQLPEPNQIITVTAKFSPVPFSPSRPVQTRRARVTGVLPDDEFPVRAMEIEP